MITVTALTAFTVPAPQESSVPQAAAETGRPRSPHFTPPPADRLVVHWALPPVLAEVPLIRRRLCDVLVDWRLGPDVIDTLLLVVTELAANAVQHAGPATDRLRVTAALGGGQLWLDVSDGDPCMPSAGADVDPDAESGRGLLMVNLLVDEVRGAVDVLACGAGKGAGKTVRVRVPVER